MIGAWAVHLYTASGVVLGLMAAADIYQSDYRGAFLWMFLATVVDATDGVFARAARVSERLPWFDGTLLDNLVDYVTYVFVPALFVWQALIVPDRLSVPVCGAMLISSAYGFSRVDAKTDDHFFTGFPSYWNVVVFYLWITQLSPIVNAAIVVGLSALVFVPVQYVYPSRTPVLRRLTVLFGIVWGISLLLLLRQSPDVPRSLLWMSFLFPVYYLVLSLALSTRRRAGL